VPSVAGLSHNVKEHTEAADLLVGAQVLANLMLELAES
jgi:beta-ureidopropionase / N-carbamoyl-L-amino-acid hydrolase